MDPDQDEIKKLLKIKNKEKRFNAVHKLCFNSKKRRCGDKCKDGCGALYPNTIKRDPNSIAKLAAIWKIKITEDNPDAKDIVLVWNASDVERILRRMSDEDINTIGFDNELCHPSWLICSVLPIAPPYVRPSVRADNNTRMEDDLTHKYCDIIKTNKTLKAKMARLGTMESSSQKAIDEWYQLLQ